MKLLELGLQRAVHLCKSYNLRWLHLLALVLDHLLNLSLQYAILLQKLIFRVLQLLQLSELLAELLNLGLVFLLCEFQLAALELQFLGRRLLLGQALNLILISCSQLGNLALSFGDSFVICAFLLDVRHGLYGVSFALAIHVFDGLLEEVVCLLEAGL